MQPPAKRCIFCSNSADSKEHFWPEWMHPLLPSIENPRHGRQQFNYHPSRGVVEIGPTNRQGDVKTIRIQAVCKTCNNGWMNQLEEAARPLLTPLVTGAPVAFDFEQTSLIARWIALKCIVAEHDKRQSALTPLVDRHAFRADATIPPYFRIYLASHNSNAKSGYLRNASCVAFSPDGPSPPLDGCDKNIQTVTFLLGNVFAHVQATRIAGFMLEDSVKMPMLYDTSRIWPPDHYEMVWPRNPVFNDAQVNRLTQAITLFQNAHKVTWQDLPPGA